MGFLNNSHDKANISPDILQLLPNAFPYSFGGTLLRFGKLPIIPVGCPAPHPRLFQFVSFAVHIDDMLQLFPRFIQKLEILRVGNVCRTAGGIHDEGALVLSGTAAVLVVVIVPIFLGGGSCQQSSNGFGRKTLPEFHHSGCTKGAFAGVFLHQAEEVLQIRILADMPHCPLVAALESLLDDQSAQCDPGRISPGTRMFLLTIYYAMVTEYVSVQLLGFDLYSSLTHIFSLHDFCSSDQCFASSFLQIPGYPGHPCSPYILPAVGRIWDFHPLKHALAERSRTGAESPAPVSHHLLRFALSNMYALMASLGIRHTRPFLYALTLPSFRSSYNALYPTRRASAVSSTVIMSGYSSNTYTSSCVAA